MFSKSSLGFLHREAWERFLGPDNRRSGFERGAGPFTIRAIRLPGLAGTISWPCQPELTFADELAGRVRVIATLDQQPILLHSEKWPDYDGSTQELRRLKKKMRVTGDDALVVVWGAEQDTVTAAEEIRLRFVDALDGVPHETRQPLPDGSTSFERILPGPERMYPDTDSPPQALTRERVEALRVALPPPPWERETRYAAVGVSRDTIHYLIRRGGAHRVAVDGVTDERWCELFGHFQRHPVQWEARQALVKRAASRPRRSVGDITAEALTTEPDRWQERWTAAVREADQGEILPGSETREQRCRYFVGQAMQELRGRVPGARVAKALRQAMKAGITAPVR